MSKGARETISDWLMAIAGPLLLGSLFLTWSHQLSAGVRARYGATAALAGVPADPTAWQVYSGADVLLALVAGGLMAVALWGGRARRVALALALAVALAFVVHALSAPPTNGALRVRPDADAAGVHGQPARSGAGELLALVALVPGWRGRGAGVHRGLSVRRQRGRGQNLARPSPNLEGDGCLSRRPASRAPRRARRVPVPRRARQGDLRRQGEVDQKRVASHFSNPSTRAGRDLLPMIDQIEALVVHTESEALLVEQNFIKQYKPRFNIRLRDDKSYPYIAISLDEDFPRVYFTRERHRRDRAYFGPYSNAKRVRSTLEVLGKVFMFRSCDGPEPGRRSGSPCLDYYIKRCEAPCVGYVDKEGYRKAIDGVIAFLSGRYKEIEWALNEEMKLAAAEQRFEDAARERNRLRAVRSLLERQRVAHEEGSMDAIAVAVAEGEANAQVFQIRDGVLSDRQSFYLDNASGAEVAEVAEAFILQYYASAMSVPPLVVVQQEVGSGQRLRRWPRRSARGAAATSRSAPPSAATSGGSWSWPSATPGSRSTRRSCAPSAAASSASRRWTACSRRSGSTRSRCGSSALTSRR